MLQLCISFVDTHPTASESCLPSLEMRSSTAAGGLVPTGEASTASETTANELLLRFYATEEMNQSASYDSSSFWRLFAAPYCYRVVETKSRKNRTFDLGGSRGHLHACPFLGSWRALVCGEVLRAGAAGEELQRFFGEDSLVLMPCQKKVLPSRATRGYINWREEWRSRRHGDSR